MSTTPLSGKEKRFPKVSKDSQQRGHLFILSAPSGTGKSTLCRALLNHFPDLQYSVSHTTRAPRKGERPGKDYRFISIAEFERMVEEGKWAEWAKVHGNYYGTSADDIEKHLSAGRDVLLDIDVQGAVQMLKRYPGCVPIFIMPPSMAELKVRIEKRGTDSREVIKKRLVEAENEMQQKDRYRHVVVNDQLEHTVETLIGIIREYNQH